MKHVCLLSILLSLLLISCVEEVGKENSDAITLTRDTLDIPDKTVDKSALHYDNKTSLWTLNSQLFSGFALSFYPDRTLQEKVGILHGKKQNQAIQWFPDGHLKEVAHYYQGKLHGEKRRWSSDADHVLIAQFNYYFGKAHGEQKKWYPSGELYQLLNLNMGREEGMQQAFRKNGDLYANYEAKEGRIFGLKKAALCFGLENENVQYEN